MVAPPERRVGIEDLNQWVCWRTETRRGKPTKVPYDPKTGRKAGTTAPETWAGYEDAMGAVRERGYDGVGLVFSPEDGLAGVDLDGCRDPQTGEIEPWAREIISELDSYTEISPSGSGVHVILRGTLPPGRNRKGRFEAYDRSRFFTVSGQHLPRTPESIEDRQDALQRVTERVFGAENPNGHEPPAAAPGARGGGPGGGGKEKGAAPQNGAGDTSGYGSESEADLALCSLLAFWTRGDPERIDALFRKSGLYREKWGREDYRTRTISEAIAGKTEFYEPGGAPGEDAAAGDTGGGGKPTQAELLIQCAGGADLFHSPSGDSYFFF